MSNFKLIKMLITFELQKLYQDPFNKSTFYWKVILDKYCIIIIIIIVIIIIIIIIIIVITIIIIFYYR